MEVGVIVEDDLYLPLCIIVNTNWVSLTPTLYSEQDRSATVFCPSHMNNCRQLVDNCGFQVFANQTLSFSQHQLFSVSVTY